MAKAIQRNREYWRRRFEALEDEQYQQGVTYYRDVQEQFRRATNDIQLDIQRWYQRLADNNNINYAAAKKFLKESELEEFRWTVERYIKAGKENAIDQRWMKELENASARHHISYLEAMKLQIQQHAELLSTEYECGVTDFLRKSYGEQYYRTAFEIAKGTGTGVNLARLDSRKVDAIIRRPWAQDGAAFSDRIWTNKEKLVRNLHMELTQNIIRGSSSQKAIDSLSKTMKVSRAQAGRLIMTESAAISSASQQNCLKELGVEKYEILATLDIHTSEICQEMDGKIFDMKDYDVGVTAPPFHPYCRTTTVPYFNDEFTIEEERAARDGDGKTYYVSADMKYDDWKKVVDSGGDLKARDAKRGNQEKAHGNKLSMDEKGAVIRYVSPDAYALNDKLRRNEPLTDAEKNWIMRLDKALDKLPRYKGDLNRSLTFRNSEDAQAFYDSLVVGSEYAPKQYMSATKQGVYNEEAQVQFYIQNSKQGKDLGALNSMEHEVLYSIESKFKVLNKTVQDGIYYILLEEA